MLTHRIWYSFLLTAVLLVSSASFLSCATPAANPVPANTQVTDVKPAQPPTYLVKSPVPRFKVATTTSLYDTGLWSHLEPMFV
ncbi:MAG: hypothetical protein NT082_03370, partial [Chloroflexi bacterium]|nr:hypothetical protein [Chloroflexota bacterium]